MSYLVFARKLRPQRFTDLIGQEAIYQTLINAIKTDRVAHAFLFTGPRGTGKTSCARILTKALNCQAPIEAEPCNQCEPCREISAGISADVMEIDAASNRGIEHIRELRESVKFSPSKGRYKTYIIDEVHMLTTESFNALLKTLEEPPGHVKFILATTDPHKIPNTVVSRCQRFDFAYISQPKMVDYLAQVSASEGLQISATALGLIARASTGGMRDALTTLDMLVSFSGTDISDEAVVSLLGLSGAKEMDLLLEALIHRDLYAALDGLEAQMQRGRALDKLLSELMTAIKDLSLVKELPAEKLGWRHFLPEQMEHYQKLAQHSSSAELQQIFQILLETESQMRRSSQAKLAVEMALVKICALERVRGLAEILGLLEGAKDPQKKTEPRPAERHRPEAPRLDQPEEAHRATSPEAAPAEEVAEPPTPEKPDASPSDGPTGLQTEPTELPRQERVEAPDMAAPPAVPVAPQAQAKPDEPEPVASEPPLPERQQEAPAVLEGAPSEPVPETPAAVASTVAESPAPEPAPPAAEVPATSAPMPEEPPQAAEPPVWGVEEAEWGPESPLEQTPEPPEFVKQDPWEREEDYDPSPEEMGQAPEPSQPVPSAEPNAASLKAAALPSGPGLSSNPEPEALPGAPEAPPQAQQTAPEVPPQAHPEQPPQTQASHLWSHVSSVAEAPASPVERPVAEAEPAAAQPETPAPQPNAAQPQETSGEAAQAPAPQSAAPKPPGETDSLHQKPPTAQPVPPPSAEPERGSWAHFVAQFSLEQAPVLLSQLKSSVPLDFGPERIQLGHGNPAMFRAEQREHLLRFATQYFGQTPKLDIQLSDQAKSQSLSAQEQQQRDQAEEAARQAASIDPQVRAVQEVFPQSKVKQIYLNHKKE